MSPASPPWPNSPSYFLTDYCMHLFRSWIRRRRVLAFNAQSFLLLSMDCLVYQSSLLCQTSMPSFSPLLTLWQVPERVCMGSHGWVARVACCGSGFQYCKWSPKGTTNDRQWGSSVVWASYAVGYHLQYGDLHLHLGIICSQDHFWSGDHLQYWQLSIVFM